MTKLFFALLVTIGSATALSAQSYSIKISDLDSLLWMAQKYRAADSALNSATASIQALISSNDQKDHVISLQKDQLSNYVVLVETLKKTITNDRELTLINNIELRVKKKRWIKVAIAEGGLIVVLLLLVI